jgi:hypothetical protein
MSFQSFNDIELAIEEQANQLVGAMKVPRKVLLGQNEMRLLHAEHAARVPAAMRTKPAIGNIMCTTGILAIVPSDVPSEVTVQE